MRAFGKRMIYRIFCVLSLLVIVYLAVDFKVKGQLDIKVMLLVGLFIVVIFWGLFDWLRNEQLLHSQEKELKTYQMYIQPLEELVKEIRAKQHEFDNHMNAILNMHVTIKDYEELVEKQSAYMKEIRLDDSHKYISLLKISDKILAGFLYSKIVNAPDTLQIKLNVENYEIISSVPEHDIIEVVGTLVDNAMEACQDEVNPVITISLDSCQDKLIFQTKNPVEHLTMDDIGHFFEKGYSSKGSSRGLGLYNARMIATRFGGDITVSLEDNAVGQELCVRFEM